MPDAAGHEQIGGIFVRIGQIVVRIAGGRIVEFPPIEIPKRFFACLQVLDKSGFGRIKVIVRDGGLDGFHARIVKIQAVEEFFVFDTRPMGGRNIDQTERTDVDNGFRIGRVSPAFGGEVNGGDLIPAKRFAGDAEIFQWDREFPPAGEIQGDFHLIVVHAVRVGIFGGDDEHERCAVFLVGMEPEFDGVVRSGPISWKFCGTEGGGLGVLPADGGGNAFADNGRVQGAAVPNGGVLCVNQQPWRHFRLQCLTNMFTPFVNGLETLFMKLHRSKYSMSNGNKWTYDVFFKKKT